GEGRRHPAPVGGGAGRGGQGSVRQGDEDLSVLDRDIVGLQLLAGRPPDDGARTDVEDRVVPRALDEAALLQAGIAPGTPGMRARVVHDVDPGLVAATASSPLP